MRRGLVILVLALGLLLVPAAGSALAAGGRGSETAAEHALARVKALRAGIGVRSGRELTPALMELAARKNALGPAARKEAATFLARPTDASDSDYYGDAFIASAKVFCPAGSIYCIHWVDDPASDDAPDLTDNTGVAGVPDYVEAMAAVFNQVHGCENGTAAAACADGTDFGLGWREPVADGTTGGSSNKFDVYIKDLFPQGFYGYASPECPGGSHSCPAYMVMDKDYDRFATQTETGLDAMKVTAAHEYNHTLQMAYDDLEDTWMLESTATYMEDRVYPSINDYLQYLGDWEAHTDEPITEDSAHLNPSNLKIYGSAVWNHWLASRFLGDEVIRLAWAGSATLAAPRTVSFAPDAYDKSIVDETGVGFADEFEEFSAAVPEWNAPGSRFPDSYPDIQVGSAARPSLTIGAAATSVTLDHTTFALRNLAPPATPSTVTFTATLPAGLKGAVALVGRTGSDPAAGDVTTVIAKKLSGGTATVQLPHADDFGRITAVLVNADATQTGWNNGQKDWVFSKDNQNFTGVRATTQAVASTPGVTTGDANVLSQTSATLNGFVDPNAQQTSYHFQYGTSSSYGSTTEDTDAGAGNGDVAATATVSDLLPDTTYHFRVVATNATGTAFGSDQTFTTHAPPSSPPFATTGPAGGISSNSAVITGTVDPQGKATTYTFEFGTTTDYGTDVTGDAGTDAGPLSVAASLTSLAPATTYHYRVSASNADGTATGEDRTFTTSGPAGSAGTGGTTGTSGTTGPGGADVAGRLPTGPLTLTLAVAKTRLAAALKKGLRVRGGCDRPCSLIVTLSIPAKLAKRLHLKRVVASVRASQSTGGRLALKLRFSKAAKRALGRLRSFTGTVKLRATPASGPKASVSRKVTIRR